LAWLHTGLVITVIINHRRQVSFFLSLGLYVTIRPR
jgi:hypothetical protein